MRPVGQRREAFFRSRIHKNSGFCGVPRSLATPATIEFADFPAPESFTALPVPSTHSLSVSVTSELTAPKVCADPMIDFADEINKAGLKGVLDPNSIQVINRNTGSVTPHSLSRHFHHGEQGRVRWLIEDPTHIEFEIRFHTAAERRLRLSPASKHVPLIGVGDLLRYNAGVPRLIGGLTTLSRFADLTGDGRPDLIYAGMYTYESGWPETRIPMDWGGIFCRPRIGPAEQFLFGDAILLHHFSFSVTKNSMGGVRDLMVARSMG